MRGVEKPPKDPDHAVANPGNRAKAAQTGLGLHTGLEQGISLFTANWDHLALICLPGIVACLVTIIMLPAAMDIDVFDTCAAVRVDLRPL